MQACLSLCWEGGPTKLKRTLSLASSFYVCKSWCRISCLPRRTGGTRPAFILKINGRADGTSAAHKTRGYKPRRSEDRQGTVPTRGVGDWMGLSKKKMVYGEVHHQQNYNKGQTARRGGCRAQNTIQKGRTTKGFCPTKIIMGQTWASASHKTLSVLPEFDADTKRNHTDIVAISRNIDPTHLSEHIQCGPAPNSMPPPTS